MATTIAKWKRKRCTHRNDEKHSKNDEFRVVRAQMLKHILHWVRHFPQRWNPSTLDFANKLSVPRNFRQIHEWFESCNFVTHGVYIYFGETDNDNTDFEMKTQIVHPQQRRDTHQKWWVLNRTRTNLKWNVFCIELEMHHNDDAHQHEIWKKHVRFHEAHGKHKVWKFSSVADGFDNECDENVNESTTSAPTATTRNTSKTLSSESCTHRS